jgi:hypothetical protein
MSLRTRSVDESSAPGSPTPLAAPGRAPVTARIARTVIYRTMRDDNGVGAGADEHVQRAAAGRGAPLPDDARTRFEHSLGADLSGVRVHTGPESAAAAESVGARAYATGNDIHFAEGEYAPQDPFGLHLLAHEVAHTVQQSGGASAPQYKLEVSSPCDAAELEADRAADAMVSGAPAVVTNSSGVARKVMRDAKGAPAPAGPHTLTVAEKKDAETAKYDAMAARALFKNALAQMAVYKSTVPDTLDSLQKSTESTMSWSDGAFKKMNETIKDSGEFEAWKKEMAMTLLGTVLGAVGGGVAAVGEANEEVAAEAELAELPLPKQALTSSKSYLELAKAGKEELGEVVGDLKEKAGEVGKKMDEAEAKPADGGTTPDQSKVAFYAQLSSLHSISTKQIIPLYDSLANLGEPIGEMVTAAGDAVALGKTAGKITIEKMRTDVPKMRDAASKLQKAAAQVPKIAKAVVDMSNRAKLLLPKNQADMEKRYWIAWVAQLDKTDRKRLGETLIAKRLKEIGVWSQLGVVDADSTDDQNMSIWSARAQEKVLAYRGQVFNEGSTLERGSNVFQGWNAKVFVSSLGYIGAEFTGDKTGPRAVIVGARAAGVPSSVIDKMAMMSSDDKVAYLLRHGSVIAQLQPLAAPEVANAQPDGDYGYIAETPASS